MHKNTVRLAKIHLKNFRCFSQKTIEIDNQIVLIEGENGVGKSSLLEALYYACYLRSFRTHTPKELITFGKDNFFVRINLDTTHNNHHFCHEIQVGFSGNKRLVKVDKKAIKSYKELLHHYRVISLSEDDLALVKGSPQIRRSFIDQAILLHDADFIHNIRDFRQVLENRNSLLMRKKTNGEMYNIWTEQLWNKSRFIQKKRQQRLQFFEQSVNDLIGIYFDSQFRIAFSYKPKKMRAEHDDSYAVFLRDNPNLMNDECRFGRSLFGVHLDDFVITLQDKKSKQYASRGQQKLIVLLIKIAQVQQLVDKHGSVILLLDDFMTDFDLERAQILLAILNNLPVQIIFTSPVKNSLLGQHLRDLGGQIVSLTH